MGGRVVAQFSDRFRTNLEPEKRKVLRSFEKDDSPSDRGRYNPSQAFLKENKEINFIVVVTSELYSGRNQAVHHAQSQLCSPASRQDPVTIRQFHTGFRDHKKGPRRLTARFLFSCSIIFPRPESMTSASTSLGKARYTTAYTSFWCSRAESCRQKQTETFSEPDVPRGRPTSIEVPPEQHLF